MLTGEVKYLPSGSKVEVFAYPYSEQRLSGETPFHVQVSGEGEFRLDLPSDGYFLLARGDGLFGYYGRNPIAVPEQGLTGIVIPLVSAHPLLPDYQGSVEQGVIGQVRYKGKPVSGVAINVYGDMVRGFKGMGLGLAGPTDSNGQFFLDMPPGDYYILARKRFSGAQRGPLEVGDLFGFYAANPLTITGRGVQKIAIDLVEVPEKALAANVAIGGQTHIIGHVVDDKGEAVSGVRVLLYMDPLMIRQPAMVSRPTEDDGRFELSFPKGGDYYLVARDALGGPPSQGERYGQYQGPQGPLVRVETGGTLNVRIVVRRLQ